ncbi:MAG: hypothetical protein O2962_01900 [Cyanobacteria bacterium]|nr:hypothetical protein [Cyanobacteriota bacterium]
MPAVLNKSNPSARAASLKPRQAQVKAHQTKAKSKVPDELHAKPQTLTKSYDFSKVSAGDDGIDGKLKKLLDRFQINSNATDYDNAVLSKDGNTLVVVNRGQVALKQLFGGTNAFSRGFYKVFGGLARFCGVAHKAEAANKYKELFNAEDIEMQHEPIKHLFKALKSGEYHSVSIFYKDPQTGDFTKNPAAVTIIDAYENLIEPNIRRELEERGETAEAIEAQIKSKLSKYSDYYSADKIIPLAKDIHMTEIFHQTTEGLYQAQGFKAFVVPGQVHTNPNMNSNDLNYQELDWHTVNQRQDGEWIVSGNPAVVDKLTTINATEKTKYKTKLQSSSFNPKITFVRPKDQANKAIDPFLAFLQQWSLMSQGGELRTTSKDDLALIELSEPVNAGIIMQHNEKLAD